MTFNHSVFAILLKFERRKCIEHFFFGLGHIFVEQKKQDWGDLFSGGGSTFPTILLKFELHFWIFFYILFGGGGGGSLTQFIVHESFG